MAPTMKKSGAMEGENMMRRLGTTKEGQDKSFNAKYVENMATLHLHAACIIYDANYVENVVTLQLHAACIIDEIKRGATLVEIMVIALTLVLGPVETTMQVPTINITSKKFTNKRNGVIITPSLKISIGKITLVFHLKY